MKSFFTRLRDRQHLRKLKKELAESLERKPHWEDTRDRVRWLNARLALAIKNNDREEAERVMPLCIAAGEEFEAILVLENSENGRLSKILSEKK
jgi:hypothetical protein